MQLSSRGDLIKHCFCNHAPKTQAPQKNLQTVMRIIHMWLSLHNTLDRISLNCYWGIYAEHP